MGASGAVVVTGATGALGTVVCGVLMDAGLRVHATYVRDEEVVRFDAAHTVRGDRYGLHKVDLADEKQVRKLFTAIERTEPIAALVHLAGGFTMSPLESTTLQTLDDQLSLNLRGLFLCAREAVVRMKPRGAGRIVAVGSKTAIEPGKNVAAYAASKAAVHAFVRATAEELRGTGIGVYAVVPSIIDTPANRRAMPDADPAQWVAPAEIGRVIRALLSDDLAVATGALIPVYGR